MKRILIQLSIIFIMAMSFVITDAKAQDLYLIIGQSNAAGRDTNTDPNGEDKITSNVKYLADNNRMLKARQPLNKYSTIRKTSASLGVNFGLEFGKHMYDYNGNTVYLVVNARGGTKLAQWREGKSYGYFEEAVDRVKEAEAKCNCTLKGILWHQGEGDVNSTDGSYTSSYFSSLKLLIKEFRDELGDVPFLLGQLDHQDKNDEFNDDLRKVDDADFGLSNVDWVPAGNLNTLDGTHFDAASTRILGRRYAKIMKGYVSSSSSRLISGSSETGLQIFPNPSQEMIHISGLEEGRIFSIYNIEGAKVIETKTLDVDISSLKPGTYFVVTGRNERLKFIKE